MNAHASKSRSPRVLAVANKKLPEQDYRVSYLLMSRDCEVHLALPGRPNNVPEDRFHSFPMQDGLRFADIPAFWKLWRLMRQQPFDLVHFYSTKLVLMGPLIARLAGRKPVFTLTGQGRIFVDKHWAYSVLRVVWWLFMSVSICCSKRAFFQSSADLEKFSTLFPLFRSRFRLVGSAMQSNRSEVPRFQQERITVLTVIRLLPSKGANDVLRVAETLGKGSERWRFILVGPPSDDYPEIVETAARGVKEGWLEYTGELHGQALQQAYQQADVFLFLSHAEGMPRVMLEAGFAGLLPIAYDIAANRDLLAEGLHPLLDTASVIAELKSLLGQVTVCQQRAASYQQHIVDQYSTGAFCHKLDGFLCEAMDRRPTSKPHQNAGKTPLSTPGASK